MRTIASRGTTVLAWAIVSIGMIVAIFPFVWMLRTAFGEDSFVRGLSLLPERLTLHNFVSAWEHGGMAQAMLNGAIVSLATLALQLVTAIPAAYVFAKVPFRGRGLWYGLVLVSLLIPFQAIVIPLFLGVNALGVTNTLTALIVPSAISAFGIFLLRQYMVTIPDALIDAARMDGFGHLNTMLRVVIPLSKPAILTFSLFSIFGSWNEYLWPLMVARSDVVRTPPLALAMLQNDTINIDFGALAAAAVIVTLPVIVLFLIARRSFVAGIAGGEVVG